MNGIPRRRWLLALVGIYALLLGTMWYAEWAQWHYRPGIMQQLEIEKGAAVLDRVPAGAVGALREDLTNIPYFDIGDSDDPPVILLHGTPGSSWGFDALGPAFDARGRRVIWFDLPGFAAMGGARSGLFEDLSASTYAEYTLAIMDELEIDRAHVVGWSNGGAVALRMADRSPDRVVSVTLLGAVGSQETEGSGSWAFEHGKYKLGQVFLEWGARLVPPFGYIPLDERISFIRNFDDTDQRPLAGSMQRLDTPTLVLHGRDDFLIADWAAEHHHELMPTSTLVMTEHDHFMPFLAAEETAEHIERFIARFDDPAALPERATLDLAPRVKPYGEIGDAALHWLHFAPVLLVLPLVTLVGWVLPGRAWVAVLVGATELDIGVAWLGLAVGKGVRTVRNGNGRRPSKWIGVLAEPLVQLGLGFLFVQLLARPAIRLGPDWLQGLGWIAAVLVLAALMRALPVLTRNIWTTRGRQRLRASLARLMHHEWWPAWAIYGPLVPWFVWLAIRHRHPLAFTACNPGIANGGGLAGESKADILAGLLASGDERVLYGERVEHGTPSERADAVLARLENEPRLGGLPIVMKPDAGEQGRGIKVCGSRDDLLAFFEVTPGDAMAQRLGHQPHEVGVFFVRDSEEGRVFSVNRKVFPVLVGDGRRTIELLIWQHPRYRVQAGTFLDRFHERRGEVLAHGEELVLSWAGNHRQGCMFVDAPQLVTPGLEDAVRAIADRFSGLGGGGLDYGRFDLRYENEEDLARGAFEIVEVNGVTSESTNIYDPRRSPMFAWRTLARQWSIAFAIGSRNRADGARALSLAEAWRLARTHVRGRASLGVAT